MESGDHQETTWSSGVRKGVVQRGQNAPRRACLSEGPATTTAASVDDKEMTNVRVMWKLLITPRLISMKRWPFS